MGRGSSVVGRGAPDSESKCCGFDSRPQVSEAGKIVLRRLDGKHFVSDGSAYFSAVRSAPVLPQYHEKDPGHPAAKSSGGRLQINTHRALYLCQWLRIT